MNVLYLIQTFKNLPQITRLVTTIKRSSPRAVVLISHNRESFTIDPSIFQGLPDVHVMHVSKINRVDFSLVQAYVDGIARARELGIEFDWVANITGQCYPTRPLTQFEQMLATTSYDGFMDYHQVFVPSERSLWDDREAANRYNYQYRWRLTTKELPPALRKALVIPRRIVNNIQHYIRMDTRYALQIGIRGRSDVFNDHFKLYGGQYFKTLSRRAVDYLCDFTQRQPDITNYFRHMNLPEEVFPQTVLLNNPEFTFSHDAHYYIRWEGTKFGHPHIITASDYDAIASRDVYFARKFEPAQDSRIMDMLDARIFATTEAESNSEPETARIKPYFTPPQASSRPPSRSARCL